MRLQKYLAECGICSRRKAEELILNGEIKINGETVTELGTKIEPEKDEVCFRNIKVEKKSDHIYIMLNKPIGYISSAKDQFNRKTVTDLVKINDTRIYPVGRLDYDTSGLIILTNDGDLTFKLTHPKHEVQKTYKALVDGIPTESNIKDFKSGLQIEDYKTSPASLKILSTKNNQTEVEIIIREGKNRQVRKMCEKINCPVITLQRVAIGEIKIGDLQSGKYRYLNKSEIAYLKKIGQI